MSSRAIKPGGGAGLESRGGGWGESRFQTTTPPANRYQGHVGASLIVGGIDLNGPQLYNVHPHGSYSRLPFVALGEYFRLFANPAQQPLASRLSRRQRSHG